MNVMRPMLLVVACAMGSVAFGQAAPSGKASGQQTPPPPPTIASVVDRQVSTLEKEIVDAAEAMPEDKFNFAPGSLDIKGSEYKGVRTFAEQVKHVATANFIFWSSIVGEKAPMIWSGSWLRPLWPDGRVFAHERHCSSSQPAKLRAIRGLAARNRAIAIVSGSSIARFKFNCPADGGSSGPDGAAILVPTQDFLQIDTSGGGG